MSGRRCRQRVEAALIWQLMGFDRVKPTDAGKVGAGEVGGSIAAFSSDFHCWFFLLLPNPSLLIFFMSEFFFVLVELLSLFLFWNSFFGLIVYVGFLSGFAFPYSLLGFLYVGGCRFSRE